MTILPLESHPMFKISRPAIGLSYEYSTNEQELKRTFDHYQEPISRQSVEHVFFGLMQKWKSETKYLSSTTQIVLHPAYQQIIGLGSDILPLILRELANKPDYWFWALQSITGENPVEQRFRGNIPHMTKAWLEWGINKGYISN